MNFTDNGCSETLTSDATFPVASLTLVYLN